MNRKIDSAVGDVIFNGYCSTSSFRVIRVFKDVQVITFYKIGGNRIFGNKRFL